MIKGFDIKKLLKKSRIYRALFLLGIIFIIDVINGSILKNGYIAIINVSFLLIVLVYFIYGVLQKINHTRVDKDLKGYTIYVLAGISTFIGILLLGYTLIFSAVLALSQAPPFVIILNFLFMLELSLGLLIMGGFALFKFRAGIGQFLHVNRY